MTSIAAFVRRRLLWLIPIGVCLALMTPMAFTDRTFAPDWTDHVWLVWQQKTNIEELGSPSYFLQTTDLGAFHPFFAFYGATLYVMAGLLALPLGAIDAVILIYFAAFLAAYSGWTWLSIQAGLSGIAAYLPGWIAVTAPYAVSVAYGRGDFAETVATSMIPLLSASAISIFRAPRVKAAPAAALIFSIAILAGSHTLTLLWAFTFLFAVAAIGAVAWWTVVRTRLRRLVELTGLALLGVAVSLWFLAPLVAYSSNTVIGEHPKPLSQTHFTAIGELFSPLRSTAQIPDLAADIQAQLPVLALVSAAVLIGLGWHGMAQGRRFLVCGLAALLCAVVLLVTTPSTIDELPRLWRFTQFPYRLVTYGDLLVVGLLVLGLAQLTTRRKAFRAATLAVTAIAVLGTIQAVAQAFAVPSWLTIGDRTTPHSRDIAFVSNDRAPPTWYARTDFADASQPTAEPTLSRQLKVPVEARRESSYELIYPPGPAGTVESNVTTGPYLVDVDGATVAGTTRGSRHMVLRLTASRAPRKVTISARTSPLLVAARVISLLSLVGAFGLVAWLAIRGRDAAELESERTPAR